MRVLNLTKIIKKFHWENEDEKKVCGGVGDSDKKSHLLYWEARE